MSAKEVCTTTNQETTTNICHTESVPSTQNVCSTVTTYSTENQCHEETYYTTDKVCAFSFLGVCFKWNYIQTPHQKTVCQEVQVPQETQACQDVTTYSDQQVCEDVTTTEPAETCEDIPDPVVEPEKPVIQSAIVFKIPAITDYSYTKLMSGVYEFHFTGKNLENGKIKWGANAIDVSFTKWEKYEDTKLVYIPEYQKQVVFWVRNGQSTGKILTVNL
ncbi:MAG: hypothetical protein PHQ46_11330 [Negativicutes bacterium]|nr:hypothetical protein [Negativicutes bacterium]